MREDCRIKVILLDLDGTVVDTMGEYARVASALISEITGLPRERVREEYMSTAGMAFRDQLRVMGVEGDDIERIASEFEEAKRKLLSSIAIPEKVKLFIEKLRDLGLKVFLSTNNECSVVYANRDLAGLFDGILCHEPSRGLRKGLDHVVTLELRGYRRCEILFIGDSDYDLKLYEPLGVMVIRTRGLWRDSDSLLAEIESLLAGRSV